MDQLKQWWTKGKAGFLGLPPHLRLIIPAVGIAVILAGLLLWGSRSSIDRAILFSNLTPEDAGAITEKLKAQKIPYELEGGGTTISVPKANVYDLRLSLASQGLPKGGGVGFEVFDRQNLGTTEFVQRLNYQRALQGELARTISRFPEVEDARIHIVTPKDSLFIEDKKKPSAAVVLKLRRGRTLGAAQVEGIVHLVASSVEGLETSEVTVVDMTGKILSKPQDPTGVQGLSVQQMEFQRQVEETYRQKAQSMLEKILGPHKAIVRVSADINFQQVNINEDRYVPDKDLIRSEQKSMERRAKGGAGGIPESRYDLNRGTLNATGPGQGPPPLTAPPASPKTPETEGSDLERKSETINYEINHVNKKILDFPGKIKRLSVAVVVDGVDKDGKKDPKAPFIPRTAEEMRNLANIIKNSVGFNRERGDQFEISCIPLAPPAEEGEFGPVVSRGWQDLLWQNAAIGATILVVLGLLFFLWRRGGTRAVPPALEPPPMKELPPTLGSVGTPLPAPVGGPQAMLASSPTLALPEQTESQEKVAQMFAMQPERAVDVLRLWLYDQGRER